MIFQFLKKDYLLFFMLFFLAVKLTVAQKTQKDSIKVEHLKGVVIQSKKEIRKTNPDFIYLDAKKLNNTIDLLGDTDPLKIIQMSAGVQLAAEGQSNLIVRGGNSSMNAIYIDDVYLHNASHIGGLYPALNTDYIQSLSFYKGGFHAQDGGRISSFTKLVTKSDLKTNTAIISLGLLSAKATVSKTIKPLKTSILFSGRRSFLDVLPFLQDLALGKGRSYVFYDYLLKSETQINNKNKIKITYFNSKDQYQDEVDFNLLSWKNNLIGASWKYKIHSKFKNKFTIGYSDYSINNKVVDFPLNFNFNSTYQLLNLKNISDYTLKTHHLSFGIQHQTIWNSPKNIAIGSFAVNNGFRFLENDNYTILDTSFFVDDLWKVTSNFSINVGLRFTNYVLKGHDFNDLYVEPRISSKYKFNKNISIQASYQSLKQYLHQARVATLSLPLEYYIPTNNTLPSQASQQFSFAFTYHKNNYDAKIGGYYKQVDHYTEFRNGSLNNLFNPDLYSDVVTGRLNAFGIETHAEANFDLWALNMNYTYARSLARFDEINKGNTFATVFDRPHNLNSSIVLKPLKKIKLYAMFVFASGQNYTPIEDIRIVNEFPVLNFGFKNSQSFKAYHRLDIGVDYIFKQKKELLSKLNLSVYNVYNRSNTFFIDNKIIEKENEFGFLINNAEESLFPILPSITWTLKF